LKSASAVENQPRFEEPGQGGTACPQLRPPASPGVVIPIHHAPTFDELNVHSMKGGEPEPDYPGLFP